MKTFKFKVYYNKKERFKGVKEIEIRKENQPLNFAEIVITDPIELKTGIFLFNCSGSIKNVSDVLLKYFGLIKFCSVIQSKK